MAFMSPGWEVRLPGALKLVIKVRSEILSTYAACVDEVSREEVKLKLEKTPEVAMERPVLFRS